MHKNYLFFLLVCVFNLGNTFSMSDDAAVMIAVRSKSADDVRTALTPAVNINMRHADCSDHTLLSEAVGTGDQQKVALLLAVPNIHLDTPLERNFTVLHIAAHNRLVSIAQMLILCGANIRAVNEYGRTPLHEALYAGCPDTALCLLTQIPKQKIKELSPYDMLDRICCALAVCFKRFKKNEGVGFEICKDVRNLIHKQVIKDFLVPFERLIDEQVERIVPILEHQDQSGRTPLAIELKKSNFELDTTFERIKAQDFTHLRHSIRRQLIAMQKQLIEHPHTVI